jgi:hypothetical protein
MKEEEEERESERERGREGRWNVGDRMVCFSSLTVYSVVLGWLEWKLRDI